MAVDWGYSGYHVRDVAAMRRPRIAHVPYMSAWTQRVKKCQT